MQARRRDTRQRDCLDDKWWDGISIGSWNARALLARDPTLFMRKWQVAKRLIDAVDIACVQEVHGTEHEMILTGQRLQATHAAFVSPCTAPCAGGVMTFLHKKWAERGPTEFIHIVPGRILITITRWDANTLATVGMHNFDIAARDIQRLGDALDAIDAHDDKTLILMAGDWNFGEGDDAIMRTRHDGATTTTPGTNAREARRWRRILGRMTAPTHGVPTRAASTTTDDGPQVSYASLGRAYVSLPPTTLAFVRVSCQVAQMRLALGTARTPLVSDHLTVRTTLSVQRRPPASMQPIPRWVTTHPLYKIKVRERLRHIPLAALEPGDAHRRCVQAIRAAAAATRNACLDRGVRTPDERRQVAIQLARAIHRADPAGAMKALRAWPDARKYADATTTSFVVTNRTALEKLIGEAIADADETQADGRRREQQRDDGAARRRQ